MSSVTFTTEFAYGDPRHDEMEMRTGNTPDAATLAPLITQYQTLIKGSVTRWTSSQDVPLTGMALVAEVGSSKEVEAAIQVLKYPKGVYTFKMPQPKAALFVGRKLDMTSAAIGNWVYQFIATGKVRFSDGNYTVTNGIVFAKLKPRGKRKSKTRKPKK